MRPGWCLGTPLAEQSLLCAALPASGRIRAPSTSWGDRGRSRPAHVDQLSGRCRPLRQSYAAELSRRSSDTYEFRPADRTDDYSAADFVISEALQQTDFDEIRHGVLSGWTAPLGLEPRIQLRGSSPLPSTLSRIRGDLDVRVPRRSARARASVRRWPWSSRRGRSGDNRPLYALNWTRLSCHRFVANRVRLSLFVLAYNLGNCLCHLRGREYRVDSNMSIS